MRIAPLFEEVHVYVVSMKKLSLCFFLTHNSFSCEKNRTIVLGDCMHDGEMVLYLKNTIRIN